MSRVLLLGATGTAGQATAVALLSEGHDVHAAIRPGATAPEGTTPVAYDPAHPAIPPGTEVVVSCLASRTGAPADAWAIDHNAHVAALDAAIAAGATRFVLLSAICVQKPRLAFQHAKLAFEERLRAASLDHVIVRPTSLFKSLSGQVARVKAGKPYLIFGDGRLTATKPISDADLGRALADSVTNADHTNRTRPLGGPGPALTPRDMGEMLFRLTGKPARYRSIPPSAFRVAAKALSVVRLPANAEFARIAHYYATESMLVWDGIAHRYDADATPEIGQDRLGDHYARLLRGDRAHASGDHALFR